MPTLLRELKRFYKTGKRSLPWRRTRDAYKILVSEIMLQQTQVERVIPFYERFIQTFPTPHKLAKARLSNVLQLWSGLGYNRRAKYLHAAAAIIAKEGWSGQKLPGVGPYTSAAIDAFAHNKPTVFIETNIRTVFLHHCFPVRPTRSNTMIYHSEVSDAEILPLVAQALNKSGMQPRDFYAALMDYGSYLKHRGIRLNSRSKHYAKQSKFEGSPRQKRAARLRALLARGASEAELEKALR